jgi:hypothetical protein
MIIDELQNQFTMEKVSDGKFSSASKMYTLVKCFPSLDLILKGFDEHLLYYRSRIYSSKDNPK